MSQPPRAPVPPPPSHPEDDEDPDTLSSLTNPRLRLGEGQWLAERYQILAKLGDGIFGTAWRARDARHGHDVVVRVISDWLLSNDGERKDFVTRLEMFLHRTLAGCVMPTSVVKVPGGVAVVSPFIDAVSLRTVMESRRALGEGFAPEEVLRVMLSLTGALAAMHTASPHALLRPESVMISPRGILLVDGIVGVCVAPDRLYAQIQKRFASAVPYVAPEVSSGKRPTAPADLYALGVIAVELLGGATPDQGPDLSRATPELRSAISTLLDRQPGRRPGGMQRLLDALTRAAGFAERPAEPPLPVPESVGVTGPELTSPEPATTPTPLPQALPREVVPTDEAAATQPIAPKPAAAAAPSPVQPASAAPMSPPGGLDGKIPPGRLGTTTASLPLRQPSTQSGPPPDLAVKSGPPPGSVVRSGPPAAIEPRAPAATARPMPIAPAMPAASAMPAAPSMPAAPPMPSMPAAPPMPVAPQMPAAPRRAEPDRTPPPGPPPGPRMPPAPPRYARTNAMTQRVAPLFPEAVTSVAPRPSAPPRAAPSRPVVPPAVPAPPVSRKPVMPVERSLRDDDAIDPKLLRAARILESERKTTRPETLDAIDLVDD